MERSAFAPDPNRETHVGMRELRQHFRVWMDRARAGERIVVTDRGAPAVVLTRHVGRTSPLQALRDRGMTIPATRPVDDRIRPTGAISTRGSDALAADRNQDR